MFNCLRITTRLIPLTRNSQYGPHFVEPIYKRLEQDKMKESGEIIKFRHVPIKAARSELTNSVFYDPVHEKFLNYVMRGGRKELARELMRKTFEAVKRLQVAKYNKETDLNEKSKIELNALTIFHKAVENCKPMLQLTAVKRGGATYQVPVPVSEHKAYFLSMNWLIEKGKGEPKTARFYDKLAQELIDASQNQGAVIKRKQDLHRQCEANRAYAHYRWG